MSTAAAIAQAAAHEPTWRLLRAEIKVVGGKNTDPQTGEERPGLDPGKTLRIAGVANAAIVDRVNEMLDPRGCILTNYLKNPVFLCDHDYRSPLGTCPLVEVKEDGVHFEAEVGRPDLAPLTDLQIERRSLIAQGILKTVSVGFIPLEMTPAEFDDAGNMTKPAIFTKWELLEISLVSVPCNADAIFQMKELQMSKGAHSMTPPVVITPPAKKDGAPAPGTGDSDEPPMGTAGEMLKAIHEAVTQSNTACKAIAESMTALHDKVDGLKPKDDKSADPPPKADDKPSEPVKELDERLTKLEGSIGKLAEAMTKLAEKVVPQQSTGTGRF